MITASYNTVVESFPITALPVVSSSFINKQYSPHVNLIRSVWCILNCVQSTGTHELIWDHISEQEQNFLEEKKIAIKMK